ncbi:hypothetical protein HHK36_020055 [Tetracentron sinense]|uniref:PGG domain-containing protein n=1 Tax=Tetracentron sinense TaxID=13715 RepID=A0A835DAL5_TETSI|nr:hypothetical protein HHK36_020055 [Tetracentron sinense]
MLIGIHFIDTPLHIAVSAGKTSFAREIANLKPSFAKKLNEDGYSPMHLASAMGDMGMMEELMTIGRELSSKGQREKNTSSLCSYVWEDCSLAPKFLRLNFPKVEVNAMNAIGHTALDILLQLPKDDRYEEIQDILHSAKAVIGIDIIRTSPPPTDHYIQVKIPRPLRGWMGKFDRQVMKDYPIEVRNAVLVVAVLTAAATFQTGVNPPGGVWQDNYHPDANDEIGNNNPRDISHTAGTAIMGSYIISGLSIFTICNLSGFLISYAMIILLTDGFPMRIFSHYGRKKKAFAREQIGGASVHGNKRK